MSLFNESKFSATTLDEILSLEDQDFISSAYVNLLGREPDEVGLTKYLGLWRSGFSKTHILSDLYSSTEGRLFANLRKKLAKKNKEIAPTIKGLDKAVTRYKRGHYFLVGPFFKSLYKCDRDEPINRELRALQIYLDSEELWHQISNTRAPALIKTVFQSLLGRDPEQEAIQAYSNLLSEKQDLLPLLVDVAGSIEHWQFIKFNHVDEFVRVVFQGLLGREPDEEALICYTALLSDTKDYPAFLREVVNSEEFKNLQKNTSSSGLTEEDLSPSETLTQLESKRSNLKNKPNYGRT